jgi:hypothetical protein
MACRDLIGFQRLRITPPNTLFWGIYSDLGQRYESVVHKTWRLAQHDLSPRLKHEGLVEGTSRVYGIRAQVMSAAELALGHATGDFLLCLPC